MVSSPQSTSILKLELTLAHWKILKSSYQLKEQNQVKVSKISSQNQ